MRRKRVRTPSVHHGLRAILGLRRGRTDVRESKRVRPGPDAFVDAVWPFVSPQVWAMIQQQTLTGMRPGEVVIMRTADIDTTGAVWIYTPGRHKTEHHERSRTIYLGPRAQDLLRPWLRTGLSEFLFSPREAMATHFADRRAARVTPLTPSQRARRPKGRPAMSPGDRYTTDSYRQAITDAYDMPFPHPTLSKIKREDLDAGQLDELKA